MSDPSRPPAPLALVLGTGDIASAIGWHLHRAGHAVLLLRDPAVPVLRRGMAFDDAIEAGEAVLDGVTALAGERPDHRHISVTRGHLAVVLGALPFPALLVDARLRKYAEPEELRPLAARAIGIGPGFTAGQQVHVAVETLPGAEGRVLVQGATAGPSGQAVPLGGAGSERFVHAAHPGTWVPLRAPGDAVAAGAVLGHLGGAPVAAPLAGIVRGLVRARPGLPRGTKLAEIDPRPDAPWQGIPPRAARIALGVLAALQAVQGVAAE
ncbi:hypothetical protein [Paracraurococcus lichenis]|uniref:Xanthine dehydrogenase n=1 Tax=Paracraurococcus lichenis TaxID=3064888 RepID=A0ABT9DTP2_9PROT|nr:hypothetical protein [Paracraurococcus sp. LOR1-02]MDO9707248.1 hypothetical protein [Paracraurococcus sp. LOR1-02]